MPSPAIHLLNAAQGDGRSQRRRQRPASQRCLEKYSLLLARRARRRSDAVLPPTPNLPETSPALFASAQGWRQDARARSFFDELDEQSLTASANFFALMLLSQPCLSHNIYTLGALQMVIVNGC